MYHGDLSYNFGDLLARFEGTDVFPKLVRELKRKPSLGSIKRPRLAMILLETLSWTESPEGHDYWSVVYWKIEDINEDV